MKVEVQRESEQAPAPLLD